MIRLQDVHAGYGRGPLHQPVLHGVSLEVSQGEVLALVGPNGAGKTSLLRILFGSLEPRRGSARLDDLPPRAFRRRHGIGIVPESPCLPPGWSAWSLLEEGVDLVGFKDAQRHEALRRAWQRTGLPEVVRNRRLTSFSKGMARRVLLAYALVGEPGVVLLDEPLTGLDAEARGQLRSMVSEAAERGAAVVLCSHELDEVARMAHRVLVLRYGRVVGDVEDIRDGASLMEEVASMTGSAG